jgi:hypothetical protein
MGIHSAPGLITDPATGTLVREVVAFFEKDGKGLFDLLDALCEPDAAEAVVRLRGLRETSADPAEVEDLLTEVLDGLANISAVVLEHAALNDYGPRDMHASVRWYGGRITDLHSRFRN